MLEGEAVNARLVLRRTYLGIALATLGIAPEAHAGTVVTVPAGLAPGTEYRLAYVTSLTYEASSSNISTYNSEVTAAANAVADLAALGVNWSVIGTTGDPAISYITGDLTTPVYNLAGNEVASSVSSMFSASSLPTPIDVTELGTTIDGNSVWTGIQANGQTDCTELALNAHITCPGIGYPNTFKVLGNTWYYSPVVDYGVVGASVTNGITSYESETNYSNSYSLYAISDVLTAPESAPEPSTLLMAGLGAVGLIALAKRRRRTNPAA